jgi:hypothetical protein
MNMRTLIGAAVAIAIVAVEAPYIFERVTASRCENAKAAFIKSGTSGDVRAMLAAGAEVSDRCSDKQLPAGFRDTITRASGMLAIAKELRNGL